MARVGPIDQREVERLVADPARQTEARGVLRQWLDASPKTMTYQQWLHRLPPATVQQPIGIVSSFTTEIIAPFLEVEAYLSGWRPSTRYIQYTQWQNGLLDPSLLGPSRAVAVLFHHAELLPAGARDARGAIARLQSLVETFRRRASTPLFLGLVEAPPVVHAIGFGEDSGKGTGSLVAELRASAAELAARTPDTHLLDVHASALASGDWYDARGFFTTRSVFTHKALPRVARSIARSMACLFRPRRKVLVLDLDNTLWGGIVGEDGVDGIALGTEWPGSAFVEFQLRLRELRRSGILLAINSKNNETDARAVFEQRPEIVLGWNDFSAHRINWNDKPSNLVAIAEELGLGLDSFVFADDSAMECALVRSTLPQVEVVELGADPSSFMDRVLQTQAFDTLHVSEEDRSRAENYLAEAARRELQAQVTDLESFLADIDLRLTIRPAEPKTSERIHQLIGKTNQFNLTLERLPKERIQALMASGSALYSAALADRFGDYGLIGALHLEATGDELRIANMVLSCRALGRGVEDAMLAFAREVAAAGRRRRLRVVCSRGPRNQQVFDYLGKVGFSMTELEGGRVDCRIDVGDGALPWPRYVHVDRPQEVTTTQ
jgi:FkbH-like protein